MLSLIELLTDPPPGSITSAQPPNVARVGRSTRNYEKYLLLDLDIARNFGQSLGRKLPSTAYSPPEVARLLLDAGVGASKKAPDLSKLSNYKACVSYDLWSIGMLLYTMTTGRPMFRIDHNDDNLVGSDLRKLADWSKGACYEELQESGINDPALHEVLSMLLEPKPEDRLKHWTKGAEVASVLKHRFFRTTSSGNEKESEQEWRALETAMREVRTAVKIHLEKHSQ